MGNVRIYKGKLSKELFFVGCRTALRVVRGVDVQGKRGCGKAGCACGAEDLGFSVATDEEREGFVRTMDAAPSEWSA